MNWEVVSVIVEGIGAAAVVISLVFLGIQVRIQNHERRVASVHEINEAYRTSLFSLCQPELAAIVVKAQQSYDTLDAREKIQIVAYMLGSLKVVEEAFYQYRQKRLDDYYWNSMVQQLKDTMGSEAMIVIWDLRRHQFGKDFRDFVNNLSHENNTLW